MPDPVFNHDNATSRTRTALRGYSNYFRGAIANLDALRQALAPLPETADELKAVAKYLGAPISDIVLGAKATETAVKHADLKDYRVIYFATHALVADVIEKYAKLKAGTRSCPFTAGQAYRIGRRFVDGVRKLPSSSSMRIGWCFRPAALRPVTSRGPKSLSGDWQGRSSMPGAARC